MIYAMLSGMISGSFLVDLPIECGYEAGVREISAAHCAVVEGREVSLGGQLLCDQVEHVRR